MKFKSIIYLLLIAGLAAFIFYRITENSTDESESKGGKGKMPGKVDGIVLAPREFADNLNLSGSIEPNEQVEIRSEVSGVVESINFNEGAQVARGQLLLKVNDAELRAQLAKAKTAQGLAAENERRAKLLLQKEAISQEEYDMSLAALRQAQSESQLITAQIAKTSVRAPFSGRIGLRSISKGTFVTPQTPIATLVNSSQVKLTFSIPEKYAGQMKNGSSLSFSVAGDPKKYTAKIYAIEPQLEVATRTLRLRAMAENPEGSLIPGTFANVMLPLEKIKDAIMVPSQALIPIQNGKKVFVARNGVAKEVIIETGSRTDKEILVVSGLKAGDTLLTTGVMSLKNNAPVIVNIK